MTDTDTVVENISSQPLATVTYKGCNFSFFYDDHGIGGWYTASRRPHCFPFAYTKGVKVPISDPTSKQNLWQILSDLAREQGITVAVYSRKTSDSDDSEEGSDKPAKKKGKVSIAKNTGKGLLNFVTLY